MQTFSKDWRKSNSPKLEDIFLEGKLMVMRGVSSELLASSWGPWYFGTLSMFLGGRLMLM